MRRQSCRWKSSGRSQGRQPVDCSVQVKEIKGEKEGKGNTGILGDNGEKKEKRRSMAEKKNEKSLKEQVSDIYMRSVKEWAAGNTGEVTEAAGRAMQKVFETNIPEKDWGNTEWTVFTAGAIMRRADCVSVSREDRRLLQDILARCRRAA